MHINITKEKVFASNYYLKQRNLKQWFIYSE